MRFDEQALGKGMAQGFERAASTIPTTRHNSATVDSQFRERTEKLVGDVLKEWPDEDYASRFIEVFSEMVAIAAAVRLQNNEPSLSRTELYAYLAHSAAFFNSFKHQ